jgi:hypothetical protein
VPIHTEACAHACLHISFYIFAYASAQMCISTHMLSCLYAYLQFNYTYIRLHYCTRIHMHSQAYSYTHRHSYIHTHTYAHMPVLTHTYARYRLCSYRRLTHSSTHVRTLRYTHIHFIRAASLLPRLSLAHAEPALLSIAQICITGLLLTSLSYIISLHISQGVVLGGNLPAFMTFYSVL